MTKTQIKEFILESKYNTIYKPLVFLKSKKVFAYEALSHFSSKGEIISCSEFFKELHQNKEIFFFLEKRNKKLQINEASRDKKLILHFDPKVFKEKEYRIFWRDYLLAYKDFIIIEITNQDILSSKDIENQNKLIKWMKKNNFDFIINVFSNKINNLDFENIEDTKYIKIDKSIILKAIKNNIYIELLQSFVNFCKKNKSYVIVSHIDTKVELNIVKKINVDFISGSILS
ncbi:MAG: EAL domain-containing protein [Campylobacterales bacterium]|nr:EAL domain-containing protein [Campylobacterales bacterium]